MKTLGYYNGKYDEIENMTIPMIDRVSWFGDGIYDATYSHNHKIFDLDHHLTRFYNSAKILEINIPIPKDELAALLKVSECVFHLIAVSVAGQSRFHPQIDRLIYVMLVKETPHSLVLGRQLFLVCRTLVNAPAAVF